MFEAVFKFGVYTRNVQKKMFLQTDCRVDSVIKLSRVNIMCLGSFMVELMAGLIMNDI